MNISEMHIAVNQGVDKIHSLQADVLLSEEIDLELNKNIMRFINQRFNPMGNKYRQGFEQSQKRIDDLRTLLTEANLTVTFKENLLNGKIFVDVAELPDDYLYLIRQSSKVNINNCKPINFGFSDAGVTIFNATIPESAFNTIAGDGINLYDSLLFFSDPAVNSSISLYTGAVNDENLSDFIMHIIPQNITAGFSIGGIGNNLLITIDGFPGFVDGQSQVQLTVNGVTSVYDFTANSVGTHRIPTSVFTREIHPNKFIQHDDIFKLLTDPFNKTKHTAPLSTIQGDNIEIYTDDTFLIEEVKLLYLRQPAKVDNTSTVPVNCDLPDHTHQEIVDMTVSTILGNISDPRYSISVTEKMQSE